MNFKNDKIKVLHVSNGLSPGGGVAELIIGWYREIDKSKFIFDATTFSSNGGRLEEELISYGGTVHHLEPMRKIGFWKYIMQFSKIFSENKYDIVHSHISVASFIIFFIALINGVKVRFLHSHTDTLELNNKKIQRNVEKISKKLSVILSTCLLACSLQAGRYLFGEKKIEQEKVILLKNGIDIKKFTFNKEKRNEIRKKLDIENNFIIGHIGRFNQAKNHRFIINLFKNISNNDQSAKLMLIGTGENNLEIVRLVKELELEDRVLFLGDRSDIGDLLQSMDAFILPSKFEGLGMVLIEAQAAGLKCFASENVTKEVEITNLVTFINLRDEELWMEKILACKQHIRKKELENIYSSGYSREIVTKKLESIYLNSFKI